MDISYFPKKIEKMVNGYVGGGRCPFWVLKGADSLDSQNNVELCLWISLFSGQNKIEKLQSKTRKIGKEFWQKLIKNFTLLW